MSLQHINKHHLSKQQHTNKRTPPPQPKAENPHKRNEDQHLSRSSPESVTTSAVYTERNPSLKCDEPGTFNKVYFRL